MQGHRDNTSKHGDTKMAAKEKAKRHNIQGP